MKLGAHMSTAGGTFKAFQRADEAGCESMLIFTKSNRQWKAKPFIEKDIQNFEKKQAEYSHIQNNSVHASYLINIASPKPELWEKSYQALKVELLRADVLGIPTLNFHPGSHVKSGEEAGLNQIVRGVARLMEETPDCKTILCLETMAGQGTNIGYKFEHLGFILKEVGSDRVGVCMDTCHVFAAGYDIRTPQTYADTMGQFDEIVGLDRLHCFHFNDSKFEIGQKKDRHAHIGEGFIGKDGFAQFVNDPRWADHPAHLETPKTETDEDGNEVEMDAVNLEVLKGLRN